MTTLCLALALLGAAASDAATATGKPRLVVLDLAAGGVDPAVAQSLSESLAAEANRTGLFDVTTQKDISTLLGLERQKQLLGCSDESSSCLSELAGAIGARFVLSGSVTRLGDTFQLNVQTLDTVRAQTIGRSTRIAPSLDRLRAGLPYAFAESAATPMPQQPSNLRSYLLIGAGAAAALSSGALFFQAYSREQASVSELSLARQQPQLQLKTVDYYQGEASSVMQLRIVGAALLALGVGFGALGFVLYRSTDSGSTVALVPSGNGAALAGVLP
ncbi:MAG: hypothetical protein IPJ65_31850 [Archangiaceae bacterium]|nr:hypothetical protein [Archangiaceae bacterium]